MTFFALDPTLFWGAAGARLALLGAFFAVAVIVRRAGWGHAWALTLFAALMGAVFLDTLGDDVPSHLRTLTRLGCAVYAALGLLRIAFSRWPTTGQSKEVAHAHS